MGWRRWLRITPWALPLLAAAELGLHQYVSMRAPDFAAYDQLSEPLGALVQPGDGLSVSPPWAEPMVRQALGDDRLHLDTIAGPSAAASPYVVEVSIGALSEPELAGWAELERREAGPFTIRRLSNPQAEVAVFDFAAAFGAPVSRPTIALTDGRTCMFNPRARRVGGDLGGHPTWPGQRFECPGEAYLTVGVSVIADETWAPRRCVLAHPPLRGELQIRYRAVHLGRRLVGHGGLSWMSERARRGAPIQLRIEVDGSEVGTFIHADGDGWSGFDFAVDGDASAPRDVSFFVSSPGTRERDFCFEARSL